MPLLVAKFSIKDKHFPFSYIAKVCLGERVIDAKEQIERFGYQVLWRPCLRRRSD